MLAEPLLFSVIMIVQGLVLLRVQRRKIMVHGVQPRHATAGPSAMPLPVLLHGLNSHPAAIKPCPTTHCSSQLLTLPAIPPVVS